MARISLDPPKTLSYRIGTRFTRRRYGVTPDPVAAMGHNMKVGRSYALFELGVERWRALDRGLKDLAVMAAAATIGCAWCMDFGYWESTMRHKVPAEKIRAVPHWRDSDVFTELAGTALTWSGLPSGGHGERGGRPGETALALCGDGVRPGRGRGNRDRG